MLATSISELQGHTALRRIDTALLTPRRALGTTGASRRSAPPNPATQPTASHFAAATSASSASRLRLANCLQDRTW